MQGLLSDEARHADPRTRGLYDRRRRKITWNFVERISVFKQGELIYKIGMGTDMQKYHVALSFAGEDRTYVERVASQFSDIR
jgi:hypothetical protein